LVRSATYADKDSIILDSFAGSGTTAHAVLKQNAEGGNRRFILVEMDENIAANVTAERVRRVTHGYTNGKGEQVAGLGGSFQFCKLSNDPLFAADGQIRDDVTFAQLAEFVWFAETGAGLSPDKRRHTPDSPRCWASTEAAPSTCSTTASSKTIPAIDGGNVLTGAVLDILPRHSPARA
jgi:adenine-specific DNA-methyltransferase